MGKLSKAKRFLAAAAIFVLAMLPVTAAFASTPVQDARNGVVRIAMIDDENGDIWGTGTGFFVGKAGEPVQYIVTSAHVVGMPYMEGGYCYYKEATGFSIVAVMDSFYNLDTTMDCEIVKIVEDVDLAILKLEVPTTLRSSLALMPDAQVTVTDTVYALGFPGASDNEYEEDVLESTLDHVTVTKGSITREESVIEGDQYLQMDTAVNFGNSGGPLITEAGYVVGIVARTTMDAQNTNFALYIDYAMDYLDQAGISYQTANTAPVPDVEPDEPEQEPIEEPVEEPEPFEFEEPELVEEPEEEPAPIPDVSDNGAAPSQGMNGALYVVGAIAALVLIGGAIYLFVSKSKKATVEHAPKTPDVVSERSFEVSGSAEEWICPNCGQKNDAMFCAKCGGRRPGGTEHKTDFKRDFEKTERTGGGTVEHRIKTTIKAGADVTPGTGGPSAPGGLKGDMALHKAEGFERKAVSKTEESAKPPEKRLKSTMGDGKKPAPSDDEGFFKRPDKL